MTLSSTRSCTFKRESFRSESGAIGTEIAGLMCWHYLLFQYTDYHSAQEGVCPVDRTGNLVPSSERWSRLLFFPESTNLFSTESRQLDP